MIGRGGECAIACACHSGQPTRPSPSMSPHTVISIPERRQPTRKVKKLSLEAEWIGRGEKPIIRGGGEGPPNCVGVFISPNAEITGRVKEGQRPGGIERGPPQTGSQVEQWTGQVEWHREVPLAT